MSGEVSIDRRLSPSGRFIRDVTSGFYLPFGSGTPGLIWRGQTSAASTDIGGSTGDALVNIPGAGGAWDLPAGYRYDTEVCLTVLGPDGAITSDLIVAVEGSTDLGATWTVILLSETLTSFTLGALESLCIQLGSVANAPLALSITNVRTRAKRIGSPDDAAVTSNSWTKIAQYVI